MLFQAIPSFMIYPSICRVAKRESRKFREQLLTPKVADLYTQMGAMLNDTSALKPVKSTIQPCEKVYDICLSARMSNSLTLVPKWEIVAPKICTGCSGVYYCSRRCQRNDWGAHRDRCKWNQSYYDSECPLFGGFRDTNICASGHCGCTVAKGLCRRLRSIPARAAATGSLWRI